MRVSRAARAACRTMNRLTLVLTRELQQTLMQLGREIEVQVIAPIAGLRRAGVIGGQVQLLREPARACRSRRPTGVPWDCPDVLVAQELLLPQRVVGILHWQGRQRGGTCRRSGRCRRR